MEFRKIGEKLVENLKKNKEIVFDHNFFLEYAHNEFAEGSKLAIKKYKKYQEKRSEEEQEKAQTFKANSSNLRAQLQAE